MNGPILINYISLCSEFLPWTQVEMAALNWSRHHDGCRFNELRPRQIVRTVIWKEMLRGCVRPVEVVKCLQLMYL